MPRRVEFLIVGGGLAGVMAAETLRNEAKDSSILILAAEHALPYNRPPLSKRYLEGKLEPGRLLVLSEAEYRSRNIEVQRTSPAVSLRPHENVVHTAGAQAREYVQLLLPPRPPSHHLHLPRSTP